jgi:hypothetical protein
MSRAIIVKYDDNGVLCAFFIVLEDPLELSVRWREVPLELFGPFSVDTDDSKGAAYGPNCGIFVGLQCNTW